MKKIMVLIPHYELSFIVRLMWGWVSSIRLDLKKSNKLYQTSKNESILSWLDSRYGSLIPSELPPTFLRRAEGENCYIWVFWYQGEDDKMPEVVKMCINSIRRNANGHKVVVLTKYNWDDFIQMPDYIMKGVQNGYITLTHFSDLLRVSLLYEYGGLWMDATLYVTRPIETVRLNPVFDSVKLKSRDNGTISDYRWAGFFLYGEKGSLAFKTFRDVMFAFWKDGYQMIIDFLLIDYTFEMLYRKCVTFKSLVDSIHYGNEHMYNLIECLNHPVGFEILTDRWKDTHIYKLNWRPKYCKVIDGKETLYAKLLKQITE